GLQRLTFVLDNAKVKPALVLLGLGGNDMLRGIRPAETRANLDAMLAELKKRGIPVVLTGMMASPNMGSDYATAFNPIYPDLAAKYGASLYPFILDNVVTDKTLMLGDNVHPNAKGVGVIVEGLAPLVEDALPDAK
ncbi:MAG: GDSL-type esterase/lipase family protein, partial [Sphingopyxis sp.]